MKAKDTSHIGMIVGAVCLFTIFGIVAFKFITTDNFTFTVENALSLILMGCAPSIPFSPIFISTWIDKIIEYKNGKNKGEE